jgi:hypothetical protein
MDSTATYQFKVNFNSGERKYFISIGQNENVKELRTLIEGKYSEVNICFGVLLLFTLEKYYNIFFF